MLRAYSLSLFCTQKSTWLEVRDAAGSAHKEQESLLLGGIEWWACLFFVFFLYFARSRWMVARGSSAKLHVWFATVLSIMTCRSSPIKREENGGSGFCWSQPQAGPVDYILTCETFSWSPSPFIAPFLHRLSRWTIMTLKITKTNANPKNSLDFEQKLRN